MLALPIVIILDILLIYFFFGSSILNWVLPGRMVVRRKLKQIHGEIRAYLRRNQDIMHEDKILHLREAMAEIRSALDSREAEACSRLTAKYHDCSFGMPRR